MYHEQSFKIFLECSPDAAVIINSNGEIVLVNTQTEKLFGYHRDEMIGNKIEMLIPDRYFNSHIQQRNDFMAIPKTRPMGHPGTFLFGKKKNGEEFRVEISLSPVLSRSNETIIFAGIRDVTERIQLEGNQETRDLFQRIFESSMHGILQLEAVKDNNGNLEDFKYKLINRKGTELLKYGRTQIIGKRVSEILPDFKGSERFEILERVFTTGITEIHEIGMQRNDTDFWLRGSWVKLDNGIMITFDDITERKKTERKLEDLNMELEKRVRERTLELSAVNERLKSINEKLDRYAYMISHDLKAPLANIEGIANFITDDYIDRPMDKDGKELLDIMKAKVNDMRSIIENVLQSAKDEIKNKETINLNKVAKEVIEYLNPPSHFNFFIQPDLPVIRYPLTSLKQILQNLLHNAIKYMDKEAPQISISCTENDDSYILCVKDNGPGIPEEKFEEIFNLFAMAHGEDRQVESHGIGLTIVRQLVEENGGNIWVESNVGKETKFLFTISKEDQL